MIIPTVQVGSSKCWFSRVPVHPGSRVHPVHPEVVASVRLCEEGTFFFCQDHRYVEIYDICYPQKMLDSSKITIFTDFAVGHFLSMAVANEVAGYSQGEFGAYPMFKHGSFAACQLVHKIPASVSFCIFLSSFPIWIREYILPSSKGDPCLEGKKGIAQRLGTFASDFRPCVLPKTLI